jgi:hypothetical protein
MIGTGLITQRSGDAFRRRSSQHHAIVGAPTPYTPGCTASVGDIICGAVYGHLKAALRVAHIAHAIEQLSATPIDNLQA